MERIRVRIEIPRGGFVKRAHDGSIDFVSPLPCPFNYGSIPGTRSPDGDPVDALVLGRRRARGDEVSCRVFGVVDFVDEGADDPKWVCRVDGEPTAAERAVVDAFFRVYAWAKWTRAWWTRRNRQVRYRGIRWSPPG